MSKEKKHLVSVVLELLVVGIFVITYSCWEESRTRASCSRSYEVNKLNVACRVECPDNCLSCKWDDTDSQTVCDFGKCEEETYQDTELSNHGCTGTSPPA